MLIWCNGALVSADQPVIRADDRGFLLGDGVFETLLARGGEIECLAAHLSRLEAGAAVLGMALPQRLAEACMEVHAANRMTDAALRVTVTRGPGPRGLAPPAEITPTVIVTAAPWRVPTAPAHVITASILRDARSPLSRIKSLNYLPQILARQSAGDADAALMRNHSGRIACASAANVFAYVEGEWITPPLSEGALPGIMRGRVLNAGLARVAPIRDAASIEAMALTSSLIGIRGVASLDGRSLAARQLG